MAANPPTSPPANPGLLVNPVPVDPYENFKFRVKWDGKYIAGISKVSPLRRTTEVIRFRDGGDPSTSHKSPGRTEYEAITLERGVTTDTAFEDWANEVWMFGGALGSEVSLADFRKDIVIEFYNIAGQLVKAYKVYRCWVSEYEALPSLDANGAAMAIEHIRLENEGWERDVSVVEPQEPVLSTTSARSPMTRQPAAKPV
jgi:phage tail-like protein